MNDHKHPSDAKSAQTSADTLLHAQDSHLGMETTVDAKSDASTVHSQAPDTTALFADTPNAVAIEPEPYVRTAYAVWELTRKCNLACGHCGSRRGSEQNVSRLDELSTAEAFDLIHQLKDAGIQEVTLIGGEFFLRREWHRIAEEITRQGMFCSIVTGGYGITPATAKRIKDVGISLVSVSIDGMKETHDSLRGTPGAWDFCFRTFEYLHKVGVQLSSNSQLNRHSAPDLPLLYEALRSAGVGSWQLQITAPMGGAADRSHILLQPAELLLLYPMLSCVFGYARRDGIRAMAGDNIGYYGPYERLLRSVDGNSIWMGCQAGIGAIGIEADGAVKPCLSLPTAAYTGGHLREHSLEDIVRHSDALNINIHACTPEGAAHLYGFCGSCEYAELCRGGCTWMMHVFFGKRGDNPYCHHRALTLAAQNRRERVKIQQSAGGRPFDHGLFELIEEPFDAPWPEPDPLRFTLDRIRWPERWLKDNPSLPVWIEREQARLLDIYRGHPPSMQPPIKQRIIRLEDAF